MNLSLFKNFGELVYYKHLCIKKSNYKISNFATVSFRSYSVQYPQALYNR